MTDPRPLQQLWPSQHYCQGSRLSLETGHHVPWPDRGLSILFCAFDCSPVRSTMDDTVQGYKMYKLIIAMMAIIILQRALLGHSYTHMGSWHRAGEAVNCYLTLP